MYLRLMVCHFSFTIGNLVGAAFAGPMSDFRGAFFAHSEPVQRADFQHVGRRVGMFLGALVIIGKSIRLKINPRRRSH